MINSEISHCFAIVQWFTDNMQVCCKYNEAVSEIILWCVETEFGASSGSYSDSGRLDLFLFCPFRDLDNHFLLIVGS